MTEQAKTPTVSNPVEAVVMLPCPFCGGEAGINWTDGNMQSVGCIKKSMICPNPTIVVYKEDDEEFDYRFWNERAT